MAEEFLAPLLALLNKFGLNIDYKKEKIEHISKVEYDHLKKCKPTPFFKKRQRW